MNQAIQDEDILQQARHVVRILLSKNLDSFVSDEEAKQQAKLAKLNPAKMNDIIKRSWAAPEKREQLNRLITQCLQEGYEDNEPASIFFGVGAKLRAEGFVWQNGSIIRTAPTDTLQQSLAELRK